MKFQNMDSRGYMVNGGGVTGVPWTGSVQIQVPNNGAEDIDGHNAFLFNPDASEFVPSVPKAADRSSWKAAVHAANTEDNKSSNGYLTYSMPSSEVSANTFQPHSITQMTNGYSMETQQAYDDLNGTCSFNTTYHYFPEPPQYFDQEIENGGQTDFYGGENDNVYNASQPPHDDVQSTVEPESSIPLVPISCTPLYGFIGYSYSVPSNAQPSSALKTPFNSTSSNSIPVSHPSGLVSALPIQIPMQLPQQQIQSAVPLLSVPTMPLQPIHPTATAVPTRTLPLVSPTIEAHGAPKDGSSVTVYVPNVYDNNKNQKSYPSLIPAILPQNQFRYVYPNFVHKT